MALPLFSKVFFNIDAVMEALMSLKWPFCFFLSNSEGERTFLLSCVWKVSGGDGYGPAKATYVSEGECKERPDMEGKRLTSMRLQ